MDAVKLSKDGSIHVTDEILNSAISGLGAIMAVIGSTFLLKKAILTGKSTPLFAFSIYAVALVGLFTSSALHHGVNGSKRLDHILRQIDYCAIYVLIAASMTPFCMLLLKGALGSGLLVAVWFLALGGILLKIFYPELPKKVSVAFYVAMSSPGVFMTKPLYLLNPMASVLLLASGLILLTGMAMYLSEKPNPFPGKFGFHEIWHLHVLIGVGLQFAVIFLFL